MLQVVAFDTLRGLKIDLVNGAGGAEERGKPLGNSGAALLDTGGG